MLAPGFWLCRRPGNSLSTRPVADRRSTRALVPAGSRIATGPDTVATRSAASRSSSMSAVTRPLTVLASSRSTEPSARVRSPDTELNPIVPPRPWASMSPDTVRALTAPVTPSSVMAPDTLFTEVAAEIPDTIALAVTTPSWTGQSFGTVMVMAAEVLSGRSQPSSPSQLRSS